jgi:peptidoglycan/LPS O-acetylase OafA/YrhL
MQPFLVLVVLPLLIGLACELVFRNARKASWAAILAVAMVVVLALQAGDPAGTWNWVAALLVMPLPIALALAAVVLCDGRSRVRRGHRRHR